VSGHSKALSSYLKLQRRYKMGATGFWVMFLLVIAGLIYAEGVVLLIKNYVRNHSTEYVGKDFADRNSTLKNQDVKERTK